MVVKRKLGAKAKITLFASFKPKFGKRQIFGRIAWVQNSPAEYITEFKLQKLEILIAQICIEFTADLPDFLVGLKTRCFCLIVQFIQQNI